jgi:hypothetical protein
MKWAKHPCAIPQIIRRRVCYFPAEARYDVTAASSGKLACVL